MKRALPRRSLSTIRNCLVHGQSAALFTLKGSNKAIHWSALPELNLGLRAANYSSYFTRVGDGWQFPSNPKLVATRHLKRGILVGSRFSFNYFHFMCDSLIRALIADNVSDARDWPIVITQSAPQISQLLRMLLPYREIISLRPEELVHFDNLMVPISSSFSPDDPLLTSNSVIDAPYLNELRSRLSDFNPKNGASHQKKTLYIKRETFSAGDGAISRSIINQAEVIAHLEALGATVVSPESLSAEEQREIFHSADIVVAMAGSALANTVFCRPGTSIVLICQNRIVSPAYFGVMFGKLGLNYAVVACPAVAGTNPHPSHLSVTVDIPTLREAVEWSSSVVANSR